MDDVRLLRCDAIGRDLEEISDLGALLRSVFRLVLAALFAGLIGPERIFQAWPSFLRTFRLVSVGSAIAVLVSEQIGIDRADLRRVIQRLRTGIGLLGAGIMRASFRAPSLSVLRLTVHQLQSSVIVLAT